MEMDTAGSRKELNSRKNRLHRVLDIVIAAAIGAAAAAAASLAARPDMAGKRIVVLLPDTGERYLSTGLFEEE